MASRLGGALAPPVVIWLQTLYGWRTVFYLLAAPGIVWAVVWYAWFRDNPRDMPAVNEGELAIIGQMPKSQHGAPFLAMLKSGNLWAVMAMYHVFCYGSYWYIAWAPTYLVQEKGFQGEMLAAYASLPFLLGAIANGAGGYASDGLVRKFGLKIGRRAVGVVSLSLAGLLMLASLGVAHQGLAVVVLMTGFAAADCGDFIGPEFRAAAIAGGHGDQRDAASQFAQTGQRPGALEFDIVRMCVDRQDSRQLVGIDHCNLRRRPF